MTHLCKFCVFPSFQAVLMFFDKDFPKCVVIYLPPSYELLLSDEVKIRSSHGLKGIFVSHILSRINLQKYKDGYDSGSVSGCICFHVHTVCVWMYLNNPMNLYLRRIHPANFHSLYINDFRSSWHGGSCDVHTGLPGHRQSGSTWLEAIQLGLRLVLLVRLKDSISRVSQPKLSAIALYAAPQHLCL